MRAGDSVRASRRRLTSYTCRVTRQTPPAPGTSWAPTPQHLPSLMWLASLSTCQREDTELQWGKGGDGVGGGGEGKYQLILCSEPTLPLGL